MFGDFQGDTKNANFFAEKSVFMKNFNSKNQLIVLYGKSIEQFTTIQDKIFQITFRKENQALFNLLNSGKLIMSSFLSAKNSQKKELPERLEIHFNPSGYITGFKLQYGNFYFLI